ncbi:lactococcin 972 family bacteriocin [Anaerococcus provencensis]|uniref:lactococcin 972 family bacteriocin n=1 Tax=Anaerococcus provencensis TaxID=938293 RepID=UPI00227E3BD8|nr:lactococcin 972 family bacteriocin [Anaerococcus provencensis]
MYLKEHKNTVVLYGYDSGWKDFLGGRWRHGVNNTKVWSKFDHDRKVHKTAVKGAGGKFSYSGWTDPGLRASASWEKASSGNEAWANVK